MIGAARSAIAAGYLVVLCLAAARGLRMREWDIWAWTAYLAVTVSAILLAVDQGIKASPELSVKLSWLVGRGVWGFIPGVLMIAATLLFIFDIIGVISFKKTEVRDASKFAFNQEYKPEMITGKTFRNEKVVLDGYSYIDCSFFNVKFVFNGTTAVTFSGNHIDGAVLTSDNPAVIGTIFLLRGFNWLRPEIPVEIPPGIIVNPATIQNPVKPQ